MTFFVLQNFSDNCQSNCRNFFCTLIYCSLRFVLLNITRKLGQTFLSLWRSPFSEMFVPNGLLGLLEVNIKLAQYLSEPRRNVTVFDWSLKSPLQCSKRESRANQLFHVERNLFLNNFSIDLLVLRNDLITCTINAIKPCRAQQSITRCLP